MNQYPSLEEFLKAPIEEIRKIAPSTIIYNAGGTRRQARLNQIPPEQYAKWSFTKMVECINLISQHGVRHIFHTLLTEGNYQEKTQDYRENLEHWVSEGLTNKEALFIYKQFNWRVRLVGTENQRDFDGIDDKLREATQSHSGVTIWFTVATDPETRWKQYFQICRAMKIMSRQEAIQAIYGEDVPLADVFIGFGKPTIFASIASPLIIGHLDCYWCIRPGYSLNQSQLRTIFYDHFFLRKPRHGDNKDAAEQALKHRSAWNNPSVLGIGIRLGPYWYPSSFPSLD